MSAPLESPKSAPIPAAVLIDTLLLIDFTAGGTSAAYLGAGWGRPEARLTWTLGPRSLLRLPAPWDNRPRLLEFDVNPCRFAPHVSAQLLTIHVNGRCFGAHRLTQRVVLRCPLAPEIWHGRDTIDVAFDHPNFLVPRRLRQSPDARPMAVAFFSARLYSRHQPGPTVSLPTLPTAAVAPLVLTEQPPAAPPAAAPPGAHAEVYPFGIDSQGSALAREGWAPPEPGCQWTDGPTARVSLPPPPAPGPRLLRLTCSAFTVAAKLPAQELSVILGGRLLAHLTVAAETTFALPLPAEPPASPGALELALYLPTAARPVDFGIADDTRRLGLCLRRIAIETLPPALAGWAGRRADEVAPDVPAPREAEGFCGVPDAELAAAVAAGLGRSPAALLGEFAILADPVVVPREPGGILVLAREPPPTRAEALAVLQEINRHGRNTLLYLVPGAATARRGAVESLGPLLLRGHIGAFAPGDGAIPVAAAEWLRLCANAWTLRESAEAAAPPPAAPALPSPATMLRACESLGDSGEFGIVQRRAGLEVLSLFRSADTPLPGLIAAFAEEFAAIADPAALTIALDAAPRPQYVLSLARYGMRWPTQVHADETDAATTLRRQAMKLGYLRRKFLDSLRAGGRLFVLRRDEVLRDDEVAPLAEALAGYGRHTLLYIVAPGTQGEVASVAPGVLRGGLARVADPGTADSEAWLALIAGAWPLHIAHVAPGRGADGTIRSQG